MTTQYIAPSEPSSALVSGLTVDGIPVPQEVEADGSHAVESYVARERAVASLIAAPATAPNPPTTDEGVES